MLAHYENQSEDEQSAEIEAAGDAKDITMMAVPTELAPEVRAMIARKQSAWARAASGRADYVETPAGPLRISSLVVPPLGGDAAKKAA